MERGTHTPFTHAQINIDIQAQREESGNGITEVTKKKKKENQQLDKITALFLLFFSPAHVHLPFLLLLLFFLSVFSLPDMLVANIQH